MSFQTCANCPTLTQCSIFGNCRLERSNRFKLAPEVAEENRFGAIGRKLDELQLPRPAEIPSNVVLLGGISRIPIPVERVLDGAAKRDLTRVVIIGEDKDGGFYFASTDPDGGSVLWDLEIAKLKLLNITMPRDADAAD